MKDKDLNQKNDIISLKIKRFKKKGPSVKRDYIYSNLNNYEAINKVIKESIFNQRGKKELEDKQIILMVLNHPNFKEIYFESKDQWDLLYKYNIIDECIINQSLKIDFMIIDKNDKNYIIIYENNKKAFMKYIIQNMPINTLFNSFINFIKEKKLLEEFEKYLINDLIPINTEIDKTKKDDKNNIIENNNKNKNDGKINKLREEYFININDFINILNMKMETISRQEKSLISFNKIKNIIKDDKEKNVNINETDINFKKNSKTYLDLNPRTSIDNLFDEDDGSFIKDNSDILKTALNPPSKYDKILMDNNNFFKKIEKKEYYNGIEEYKDLLIRESKDALKKINYY